RLPSSFIFPPWWPCCEKPPVRRCANPALERKMAALDGRRVAWPFESGGGLEVLLFAPGQGTRRGRRTAAHLRDALPERAAGREVRRRSGLCQMPCPGV